MRVLVRLPNWLGDLLMARPLLHSLRASHPKAEIWAIGKEDSSLLEREAVWNVRQPVSFSLGELRHAPSLIENMTFDAALIMPSSFSSAWRLQHRRIARRIGFAAEGRSWLLTDAIRRPARGEMHLSEEYLLLGERLGLSRSSRSLPPPLAPTADERAAARSRLRRLEIENEALLVLAPGAAYGPAKRWRYDRFVALGRRFAARGFVVLVCGAPADGWIAGPMATEIGPGAHALAGQTSLGEQLALCALAKVTVSNDSGLAHLAAGAGAPTVVIFGSTSSAWTAPLGPRVAVVQRAPVCSPCFQRACAIGYRCLDAIPVEAVERAAAEIAT